MTTGPAGIVAHVPSLPRDPDPAPQRKARGAFFTPAPLCDYLARWAVRDASDVVLEPSCGEAAFLLAAGQRLNALGASANGHLRGVELHRQSARLAEAALAEAGVTAHVRAADFFSLAPVPEHDAVIGNPPYVRYQDFSGSSRSRARTAALAAGVRLTALASSWAAFTVHASLFLKPEGRLGLVLPAELLSVNYAGEVRRWLMRRFARVRLVLFTERVFPGVLEEVVLLMAEGRGPTDHCELHQVHDLAELIAREPTITSWRPSEPGQKWTQALVDPRGLRAYRAAVEAEGVTTLHAWGETTLGAVTGNNRFFALASRQVDELGLGVDDVLPLSPPGSRHLRRLAFDPGDWAALERRGAPVWLFRPGADPSPAAARYIARGEEAGVSRAYKCRVRSPWWQTPLVPPADLLVTCMNADTPRLCANDAGVHHLNSVHGLYLRPEVSGRARELLPLAALNSLTLLGAETVGRAYGGGLLKLEPREADLLPVPSPDAVASVASRLAGARAGVERALADGDLLSAVARVDEVLLRGLGLSRAQVEALRASRAALAARRQTRGRRPSRGGRGAA